MTEPDVTLTDYALALECGLFAVLLWRREARWPPLRTWFVVFYGAIGAATLSGGTVHGFFLDPASTGNRILWPATLLAVGFAALAIWVLGAWILFSGRAARWISAAAALGFVAYAATVLFVSQAFWVAIVYYLPASTFLLVVFLVLYLRTSERRLLPGVAGIALTFVASAIQTLGIAIHPVYFNHNAFYHVVQAVALLLIFLTGRWLVSTFDKVKA